MKRSALYFLVGGMLLFSVVQCTSRNKIQYNIPKEISGERKTMLLANLEKGKVLFKRHCSGCHGIFSKGKDSIPNFTHTEIKNYLSAYQSNDPKNHAVIKKLLPEEMSMIMTFLQMRKIDSVPQHIH
jgi:hypothetical protein